MYSTVRIPINVYLVLKICIICLFMILVNRVDFFFVALIRLQKLLANYIIVENYAIRLNTCILQITLN